MISIISEKFKKKISKGGPLENFLKIIKICLKVVFNQFKFRKKIFLDFANKNLIEKNQLQNKIYI